QTGPKNRLARRVLQDIGLKSNSAKVAKRITVLPGLHGKMGRRKSSEYAEQLLEKQKVKHMYGLLEKQFRKQYELATRNPSSTGKVLLISLERRLDNVIFRLGFANTRAGARQLVNHEHVLVNDKKVSIPSYSVKKGDVIRLTDKTLKMPVVADLLKEKKVSTSTWLKREGAVGMVATLPEREDIDAGINEQLIIEFYSR
ncbi:MAG: 30S ribosomal protein S4, partial [Candidatus Pacebacteria bacterium RIFOXYB1_FULL_44_10]